MKSFLLIGMGKFGHHLCRELAKQSNDIMIVDEKEEKLTDLLSYVASAKIGDCTKAEVLRSFSVDIFDACIVCVADDFQSSLEITDLLHDLGAKKIISLASTEIQAKFLLRSGADHVIFPERDVAQRVAARESNDSIFDCIELSDEYSVYEIAVPDSWCGKTLQTLGVRTRFQINVLAVKSKGQIRMPNPQETLQAEDHLVILGTNTDVHTLIK